MMKHKQTFLDFRLFILMELLMNLKKDKKIFIIN